MDSRIRQFQKILKEKGLDGFIVTNPINIFYLTGFQGISATERESILIFNPKPTLITARLYQTEGRKVASTGLAVKIVGERNQLFELASKVLTKARRVGFEEENLKYSEFKHLQKVLKNSKLLPFKNLVEDLRVIKSSDEIRRIEKAQAISHKAYEAIVKTIKLGQTEEEISERLTKIIKSLGGQGLAFEPIIASGTNSAVPHYITGKKKIKKGEVLLMDFGAKFQDYSADLSRTIFIGRAKDEHRNIYDHVETAQQLTIGKISHGLKTHLAFHAANDIFKKHNLDKFFLHGLGHGIGLNIHERPYLRPQPKTQSFDNPIEELLEGMVFSVEPGLYFPWGGVRIEDLVVIQNGKAKVLGKLSESIEIDI